MFKDVSDDALPRIASTIALLVALGLVVLKMWAWLATDSASMLTSVADAMVDVAASSVTFAGVRYAKRSARSAPSKRHNPIHARIRQDNAEAIAALVQALLLAGAAIGLGMASVQRLITPHVLNETSLGIAVIAGSSVIAGALVWMQTVVAKRTGSMAIAADRAHYLMDLAVNVAALIALLLDRVLGWTAADAIGALLIALYMLWSARDMASDALVQAFEPGFAVWSKKSDARVVNGFSNSSE